MSGGPDSVAMLLLAAASVPADRLFVATVDHGLRPEAADEATGVAALCGRLGLVHETLAARWDAPPTSQVQAHAREIRYDLLAGWSNRLKLDRVATAHHADDQAETLLMRLSRGAGLAGLAGIRASRPLALGRGWHSRVIRPLLGWRRAELAEVVAAAGIAAVDDPANRDPRHERSRARAFLAAAGGPEVLQVAASAAHLAEGEEAMAYAARSVILGRETRTADGWTFDPADLPREWRRRMLVAFYRSAGEPDPRGPALDRLLEALGRGETATLGAFKWTGGARWHAVPAPPRRG
ncbi:tRNA lysidine(34) synthetase TilS [Sphingomonas sp. ASV193]|uniref:tRNA lysidine(34) synthetase TilS n=1 Tax=Sphingomonas sp. ASV193 TaxID=3144405 RepID=UPI0032E8B84D